MRPLAAIKSSILTLWPNVNYYFINNSIITKILFKPNNAVNYWALMSSHWVSEAPFKCNIWCIFIVLTFDPCIYYMSFDRLCPKLSGRSLNGICALVLEANLSEWGFAKLGSLFVHFFSRDGGHVGLLDFIFPLCNGCSWQWVEVVQWEH